jgi:hypothetical protein
LPAVRQLQAEIIRVLIDDGATLEDEDLAGRSVAHSIRAEWIRALCEGQRSRR